MAKNNHYRRHLVAGLSTWLLLFILCVPCIAESPPIADSSPALQRFVGLDRHYNLSFLLFDRLAAGQLSFSRDPSSPQRYRARLEAKTLGVAAWLTGDKVQQYETLMELTPQGRLQPLEYTAIVHKKKGTEVVDHVKLYTFDSVGRTITLTRSNDGKKEVKKPIKISGKIFPVDFLTAGFNFISGADGPIMAGKRKEIIIFTDKGEQTILLEVLRPEEWPKDPFFRKGQGILLKIILPPKILDTGGGVVYALLDAEFFPARVLVKNVLGMGDVQGSQRP